MSASCRACTHARACVSEASQFLDSLPDSPGRKSDRQSIVLTEQGLVPTRTLAGRVDVNVVVASTRGLRRLMLSPAQLSAIATLPEKVASQVKTLLERGWFEFARRELNAGKNPEEKGWRHVYCRHLLSGVSTRASLELAFIEELQMAPASAKVKVCTALAIFAAGNLAVEVNGILTVVSSGVQR